MAGGQTKELKMGVDYLEKALDDMPGPQALIEAVNDSASLIPSMLEGTIPVTVKNAKDAVHTALLNSKQHLGSAVGRRKEVPKPKYALKNSGEITKQGTPKSSMKYPSIISQFSGANCFGRKNEPVHSTYSNAASLVSSFTNLTPPMPSSMGCSGSPVLPLKVQDEQTVTLTLEPVPPSEVGVSSMTGDRDYLMKNISNANSFRNQKMLKQTPSIKNHKFSSYLPALSTNKFLNSLPHMLYSNEIPRHAVVGRKITEVFLDSKYPASDALANAVRTTAALKNSLKRKHHDVNDVFVRYLNRPKYARHDPHVMICKSEFNHSLLENSSPSVVNSTRNGFMPWLSDKIPLTEYTKSIQGRVKENAVQKSSANSCRFKTRNLSKYRVAKKKQIKITATSKPQWKNLPNKRPSAFNFSSSIISKRGQFVATDRLTWDSRTKKFTFPSSIMAKAKLPKTPCFSFPTVLSQQRSKFSKPLSSFQSFRGIHKPKATNRFIPTAQRPRPAFSQTQKYNTNKKVSIQPQKLHNLNEILLCTTVPKPSEFSTIQDYCRAAALYQAKSLLVARALARGQCVSDEQDPSKVGTGDNIVGKLCSVVNLLAEKRSISPYSFVLLNAHTEEALKSWETSLHFFRDIENSVEKEDNIEDKQENPTPTLRSSIEWFYNSDALNTAIHCNGHSSHGSSPLSLQSSLAWHLDEFHEEEVVSQPPGLMECPAISPQRDLHCETRSLTDKKDFMKLDINHNASVHLENDGDRCILKTPYCQNKVALLPKKEGCICKQKCSRPPPSYCVRFRGGFYPPDCCSNERLPINWFWYGNNCQECLNSLGGNTSVECMVGLSNGEAEDNSLSDFNCTKRSLGSLSSSKETAKGKVVCNSNGTDLQTYASRGDCKFGKTGIESDNCRNQNVSDEAASVLSHVNCKDSMNTDTKHISVHDQTHNTRDPMIGDTLDTHFLERLYGKSLDALAKIAWESGSFSTLNEIQEPDKGIVSDTANCTAENQNSVQVQSSPSERSFRGENPNTPHRREDFAVVEQFGAKPHEKVVGRETCQSSSKIEKGSSATVPKANHCLLINEENRLTGHASLQNSASNTVTGESLIGCVENSNRKHMGVVHGKRDFGLDFSSRTSAFLTDKTKDKSETSDVGDLPAPDNVLVLQNSLRTKLASSRAELSINVTSSAVSEKNNSEVPTSLTALQGVENDKMGREGIITEALNMECNTNELVNSVEKINNFKLDDKEKFAVVTELNGELTTSNEVLKKNEEGKVGSSIRLRSKRTVTKRGRYEDDYVTDLPKNSKKAKKSMPCRDYDQDIFWDFYRKCQSEEHSKYLVLRHRYIKFFMENDINCKTLSFAFASNAFTCAAPSLQYASSGQPKPVVPESGFLPFMQSFTKTRKHALQPLKPKKDNQCPYCGRSFSKEPRTVLQTHIARHNMGQWKILAAPKHLVRKKKRKLQKKTPAAKNKSSSQSTVVFVDDVKNSKHNHQAQNTLEPKTPSAKAPLNTRTPTSMSSGENSELENLKTIKAFPRPSNISMGHRKQTARKSFSNLARNLSKENLIAALTASSNNVKSVPFKAPSTQPTEPVKKFAGNDTIPNISECFGANRHTEGQVKNSTPHSSEQSNRTDKSTKHVTKPLPRDRKHHHRKRSIGLSKYANNVESPTKLTGLNTENVPEKGQFSSQDGHNIVNSMNKIILNSSQKVLDKS